MALDKQDINNLISEMKQVFSTKNDIRESEARILNAVSDEFIKHRKAMRVNYVTYEDMEKMIEQVKAEILQELTQQSLI
ncbi:MAG: hypothetical protein R2724_34360 [Bryobacterales bacterium]